MPHRDRATVDVVDLGVDSKVVAAIERLHRERLVQFPKTDVIDLETVLLQQLGDGMDRADAHLLGRIAGDCHASIETQGREAATLGQACFHQDARGGAVRELARIAGRDEAPFPHRLQAGKALQRRIRTIALVLGQRDLLVGNGLGLLVHDRHRRANRDDLGIESASGLRSGGSLLGHQRQGVLLLARNAELPGDELGRVEHRHVGVLRCGNHRRVALLGNPFEIARLDGRDVVLSASHDDVHPVHHDLLGRGGDGHQARGALTVHRLAGHGLAETSRERCEPGQVHAGRARGQHRADDDIVDLRAFDACPLCRMADRMAHEGRGLDVVEASSESPADGRSGGADNDGLTHERSWSEVI